METKKSEELERPWRKTVSSPWKGKDLRTIPLPEMFSEDEETESSELATQENKSERCSIPIRRDSMYCHTMRLRRQNKNYHQVSDSPGKGNPTNDLLSLVLPGHRKPPLTAALAAEAPKAQSVQRP
ncbi:ephexin-1-like [Tachyglossus aculeatus]|uniref:ephexin-1-like n=1 Tax=Tachyglossus aculeatus TaxID=9261 RepID=UPI0018F49E9B|nr:ephexin-1-like [Tachyglossus aculeatus]